MSAVRKAPGRIFINYRRDDAGGVAGRLADSLNRYFGSERVFRDVDGITVGANFEDVLQRTGQEADAMIVLIGRQWARITDAQGRLRLHQADDWVAREIAAALARGIPIYPVLVEAAQMPQAEDLPEPLRPLTRHHAMAVSDQRWLVDVTRLARVMAQDIPGSAAERTLATVQWAVSLALFAAVAGSSAWVSRNLYLGGTAPLSLAVSGITFLVVVASAMVLLYHARLLDAAARPLMLASAGVGLLGTLAFWLLYALPQIPADKFPVIVFGGANAVATAMLVLMSTPRAGLRPARPPRGMSKVAKQHLLMSLSRFKAR